MRTSVRRFLDHVQTSAPAFECFACHDENEKLELITPVQNLLQDGAYPEMLAKLKKWLEDPGDQFAELYAAVDGAMLFAGDDKFSQGIHFCSLFEWEFRTHEMRKDYLRGESKLDERSAFLKDSLVFAVVPASGNCFVVIAGGEQAGQIHYLDHDDWSEAPFAANLFEFLGLIVEDSAKFLNDIGCYTRYSDGRTQTQWVPKRFLPDINSPLRERRGNAEGTPLVFSTLSDLGQLIGSNNFEYRRPQCSQTLSVECLAFHINRLRDSCLDWAFIPPGVECKA